MNLYFNAPPLNLMHFIIWCFYVCLCVCVCGFRDLVIHSTAVNSKHSPAPSDCVVRSFIPMVAMKDREMEMKAAGSDSRKYHPPKKLQRAI